MANSYAKEKKLTAKQTLFVEEYLVDLNATQAAIRAGYSRKTAAQMGAENLTKPVISNAIATKNKKRLTQVSIDASWVLKAAREVYDRCMQSKPVLDHQGKPTGEYTFAHAGANRAIEIIGKHVQIQAFLQKVEVTETHSLADRMARARKRVIENTTAKHGGITRKS